MTTQLQLNMDALRWQAVIKRDGGADGQFFYAVRTTGVYCRPGCPSRLPNPENVAFFATCEEAERAGFRACKRCAPGEVHPVQLQAEIIASACRRIDNSETAPSLADLAAEANMSPSHFQRMFKAAVGLSPKQYAAARRADRFREELHDGAAVTNAIYSAGYSSSSRAYEAAAAGLGMTPSEYRNGARGQAIRFAIAECWLGLVLVAASERGVCCIEFGDDSDALRRSLEARFPQATITEGNGDFTELVQQVVSHVEAPTGSLDLPLDIQGTAFQQRVWQALRDIPAGATATYQEIAKRIGEPNGSRAVARACASNKIALAIPCHRVVRADGSLSGYRWGVDRKAALMERERSAKPA